MTNRRLLHLLPVYCLAKSVDGFHLPTSNVPQKSLYHAPSTSHQRQRTIKHDINQRSISNRRSVTTLAEQQSDNNDDVSEKLVADRSPCFDNGFCGAFPGDDEVETNNGATSASTNGQAKTVSASSSNNNDPAAAGEAIQRLGIMTGPTVWSEFGRLSQEHPVANLGQGFPDWLPPEFAVESLVSATIDSTKSPHQYTRTAGHPNLVKQLARRYSQHLGTEVDAMNEVAVTVGASQALYLSLQVLVKPGDEVLLFEPFFDLYVNQIKLAGGTPVYVPLTFVPYNQNDADVDNGEEREITGGTWILEPEKLKEKISSKTRAIILNSPHNPTGKIFTLPEMEMIAEEVINAGPQCVVISDEVYKYIIHSPPKDDEKAMKISESSPGHVHFASLPNMWERTITVSSAGKTFSATGWQCGWCIGPSHLISPIHQLLPYVQFCASTVIQEALARSLPRADEPYEGYESYYHYLNDLYRRKRDLLGTALKDAGFAIPDYDVTPGGGFFIFARITPELKRALPKERLELPFCSNAAAPGGTARLDWALCQWMAEEKGVLCIPSSPFFSRERALEGASDEFIRVAFCKTDETIEEAALALKDLRSAGKDGDEDNVDSLEKEVAVAAGGV